jgi:hypothetical protein
MTNRQKLFLIKSANLPNTLKTKVTEGLKDLKTKAYKNPDELKKGIDLLMSDKVSVPIMAALLGGAGYGMFGGGDEEEEEQSSLLKRLAQGAGIGGAVGLGSTFAAPSVTNRLNDLFWKDTVGRGLGRVVSNTIAPYNYLSPTDKLQRMFDVTRSDDAGRTKWDPELRKHVPVEGPDKKFTKKQLLKGIIADKFFADFLPEEEMGAVMYF